MKTFKEYIKANINEGKSFDPISGRKLMSAWIMAQEEKSKSTASFLKNGVKISNQTFRYYSTPVEFIQGLVTNSKFKEEELTDIVKKINRQKPDKLSEYAEKILSSMNENVKEYIKEEFGNPYKLNLKTINSLKRNLPPSIEVRFDSNLRGTLFYNFSTFNGNSGKIFITNTGKKTTIGDELAYRLGVSDEKRIMEYHGDWLIDWKRSPKYDLIMSSLKKIGDEIKKEFNKKIQPSLVVQGNALLHKDSKFLKKTNEKFNAS